jgi:hypothetical protein
MAGVKGIYIYNDKGEIIDATGGKKAALTNKERYGEDFYKVQGSRGGSKTGVKKGFALSHDRAVVAGRKGGAISRRGPIKTPEQKYHDYYSSKKGTQDRQNIEKTLDEVEQNRPGITLNPANPEPFKIKKQGGFIQDILGRFTK